MKQLATSFGFGSYSRANRTGLLLAVLVWLLLAGAVSAHALLTKSEPEDGARLEQAPEQVTAWFSQELDTGLSLIQVFDAEGGQVDNGDGGVDLNDPDHASMIVTLPAALPAGGYTARWTVVSADDSDLTEGEFSFSVGAGELPAGQPSTTTPSSGANNAWPAGWLAAGVGILLLAVVVFIIYPRLSRSS